MIKVIFFGDIVSFIGREGVKRILPQLKEQYQPDIIIANAENISHGKGVSKEHFNDLQKAGIDFFTSGNHIYARKQSIELLESEDSIIRPANYPAGSPGVGFCRLNLGNNSLIVLNLQGQVFMREHIACPFRTADEILSQCNNDDTIIVDMHAETTSEKVALGHYLDGRVAAVFGTHTHVQTADEKILSQGTAYISDVGGCYAQDSVIGVEKNVVIEKFLKQHSAHFTFPKTGKCLINAVYLELENNKAHKIERINQLI